MPRVKIDTPGVTIELDANEVSIKELGDQALQLYRDATAVDDAAAKAGPAYGFTAERRGTADQREFSTPGRRFGPVNA